MTIDTSTAAVEVVVSNCRSAPNGVVEILRALAAERDAAVSALKLSNAETAAWETAISAVMPPDFKDWHENNKSEWPVVCAMVIHELRHQVVDSDNRVIVAQAETAAAYERAECVVLYWQKLLLNGETIEWHVRRVTAAIRALATPDHRAALDAMKAEAIASVQIELDRTRELLNQKSANNRTLARNLRARKDKIENAIDRARTQGRADGMRVAAGIVSWRASETDSPNAAFELSAALNVIRAAIMKGGAE